MGILGWLVVTRWRGNVDLNDDLKSWFSHVILGCFYAIVLYVYFSKVKHRNLAKSEALHVEIAAQVLFLCEKYLLSLICSCDLLNQLVLYIYARGIDLLQRQS